MAFPTIPTTGANTLIASVQGTATTTHTFASLTTLDNASGDLLIAVIVLYQASATGNAFSSWGGGFTEFGDSSSATDPSMAMGCAYKISDGTETGTFTVTSSISGRSAMFLMSVKNWHGTTIPEVAFSAATTTTAQDPPNLDPAGWGAEDTLWIAVAAGGQTSLTGSWGGITSAPASYTDYAESSIAGGDVIGACQIAVAFFGNNVTAENPGSFTTDTSPEIERAATIAVRPVRAPVEIAGNSTITATETGTIAVDHTVDGARAITAAETGTIAVDHTVDGTRPTTVTLAGTITADHMVDGTRAITATETGTIAVDHTVDGSRPTTVTLSGTITADHTVDGTRPVTATITGDADVVPGGAGSQVDVDGALAVTASATGTIAADHAVSGSLAVAAGLAGDATVTGAGAVVEVDGSLSILVTFTSEPPVGRELPHVASTAWGSYAGSTPAGSQGSATERVLVAASTDTPTYTASTARGVL